MNSNDSMQPELEVPVLVVGAGPAGLTAALMLKQLGIQALTVTRHHWTANTPRAHYQNQRSIEILRELGLEEDVLRTGLSDEQMANVVWASSLSGTEFARLPTYMAGRRDDYINASPCRARNIPQHLLEPIMAKAALERGVPLRWSQELLNLKQDANGVLVYLQDRHSNRKYCIRAQYVIGADGARSRVVKSLGIPVEGPEGWAAAVNVWFKADLSRHCAHRPGMLFWINRPGSGFWIGSGAFINVRPWNEWVLSFMYDPAQGEPDLSNEALTERIRSLVGDEHLAVEVLAGSPWLMNAQVVQRMACGRVFIAGDAAHRHPPSGGLGSNTSMQDAYNLAWKLKYVLQGKADPALLQTYELERHPVARQVVDRSMKSAQQLQAVAKALGFTSEQTEEEGWAAYRGLHQPGSEGRHRRQALQQALALQQYHFCGHGVELGVRYLQGALINDSSAPVRVDPRDPEIYYAPLAAPGCHVPHAWLEHQGQRVSTLDITGRGRFVLLVGHDAQGWHKAVEDVRELLGNDIEIAAIGVGLPYTDVLGQWANVSHLDEQGCLLIRPDKVIAWRCPKLPHDPSHHLLDALRQILGQAHPTAQGASPHETSVV